MATPEQLANYVSRAGTQFAGVPLNAGNSVGSGERVYNVSAPDPWREFLLKTIMSRSTGTTGQIPEYTMGALENLTRNPASAAAEFFPQMARPLLEANRVSQDRQTSALTDLFRKAGGTDNAPMQSGSFAQAGRQLVGDFARQDQEILAKNYIPLTAQISENINNAIGRGLAVPQATSESLKPLVGSIASLQPLSTMTEKIQINPGPTLSPQYATAQANNQAAAEAARAAQWNNWWNS